MNFNLYRFTAPVLILVGVCVMVLYKSGFIPGMIVFVLGLIANSIED